MTDTLIEPLTIITYCHRYPAFPPEGATVIRFSTGGKEINGSGPIEAIPLCSYDEAAQAIAALAAENERLREALKATPLRAKNESGRDFDDRQTAWLRPLRYEV